MRVTNQMLTRNVLQNLQGNLQRLQKTQEHLSSGRSINKPSDNPLDTSRIMNLNTRLGANEQYSKNIETGRSWLGTTEGALRGVNDILQRARELTIRGANDTMDDSARKAIIDEVDEMTGSLLQLANSSFEDRYIFGGHKTGEPPFSAENGEINYGGNEGDMQWEISQGVRMTVNITGEELFGKSEIEGEPNEAYVFNILDDLKTNLEGNDTDALQSSVLSRIDDSITNILNLQSEVGAKVNRLDMSSDRSFEEKLSMSTVRSKLYDIDMAELLTDYQIQENVYNASLSIGARSIQPSLIDFLR